MNLRQSILPFAIAVLIAGCGDKEAPATDTAATAPAATTTAPPAAPTKFAYPDAKVVEQSDDYHGTKVSDPYRWMEDLDGAELKTWIDAQNRITQDYLADAPGRAHIKQRLTEIFNYERYGLPTVRDGRYFYSRNDGLQNQSPWYWQQGLDGAPKLLIDPNSLSADGTVSLSEFAVDDAGKLLAYSLSDGGSDWRTIKVRDVETGSDTSDEIKWAKFTEIDWSKDGKGFYYSAYDAPPEGEDQLKSVNKFQKLYYHVVGKPQSEDTLVYERKDEPDWGFGGQVSDDGKFLVISVWKGTDERNLVFYKDLTKPDSPVVELIKEWTASYDYLGNDGNTFFMRTDDSAERYRIIGIDTTKPAKGSWRDVVTQDSGTMTSAELVNGQLVASYLTDAHSLVRVFDLAGKPVRWIELPGLGTATGFDGSATSTETFYSYTDFTTPPTVYRYDAKTGESSVFRQPKVAFDSTQYATTQVFATSRDGTKVPVFVTMKKGTPNNGENPTILYGYGGFNIAVTPTYSASTAVWLEMGGVYAVANLRGGGEYGRSWHEGGMKANKQNVFDDFVAAAEFLITNKYTKPEKLAISGRSNGGLLVAATMLQRPELFGAALPAVGVLDMLRFREFTIGWAWESDYGSVKDAAEFAALHKYSPLHNIKPGVDYPPTLITTADHDDRVFPAHSFKFAAALQKAYQGTNPMLIRVETRAGHGAGKPTSKIIEEQADMFAFLTKALDFDPAKPAAPAAPVASN